jgi:hypothetical protein
MTDDIELRAGLVREVLNFHALPMKLPVSFVSPGWLRITMADGAIAEIFFREGSTVLNGEGHGGIRSVELLDKEAPSSVSSRESWS